MKKILLLQSRDHDDVDSNEHESILRHGQLHPGMVHKVRMNLHDFEHLDVRDYAAVIVGGSPYDVSKPHDEKSPRQKAVESMLKKHLDTIYANDIPYLGICYGLGSMVWALGGEVRHGLSESAGPVRLRLTEAGHNDEIMAHIHDNLALVGHNEGVHTLPPNAVILAATDVYPVHAVRVKRNIYGVQFHPELDAPGLAVRMKAYKDHGYIKPEEYDSMMAEAEASDFSAAHQLILNFSRKYCAD